MLLSAFLCLRYEHIWFPLPAKVQMEPFCFINLSWTEAGVNVTDKHTFLSWSKLYYRASCLFLSPNAGKLHHAAWTRGKQVNLSHLVSCGRCVMWRAGYLHTELHEQKGNRQVKRSEFTFQRPHLDSFVQGRCWQTAANGVECHQDC